MTQGKLSAQHAQHFNYYLEPTQTAEMLNKALKLQGINRLIAQDIADWEGDESGSAGDGYDKADAVVKRYMGIELYRSADIAARMVGVLHARLLGYDTATIGGTKFKNLQDGLK